MAYRVVEYELWNFSKPDEHVLYSLADLDDRYVQSQSSQDRSELTLEALAKHLRTNLRAI